MIIAWTLYRHTGAIRGWWIWVYWLNPIAYAMRVLTLNEFGAPRWSIPSPQDPSITLGQSILASQGFNHHPEWLWGGVLVLLGMFFIMNGVVAVALRFLSGIYNYN